MVQRRVSHTATTESKSQLHLVPRNTIAELEMQLFRASLRAHCALVFWRTTDFYSAVIALSDFKLCLLGGRTRVLLLSEN